MDNTIEDNGTIDSNIEENSFDSLKQRKGLKILLDIILMVHQVKPSGSKWELNFDFHKYLSKVKYAPTRNNGKVDPKLLRKFILDFLIDVEQIYEGKITKENFIDYYSQNYIVIDEIKFSQEVERRWDQIEKSLETISQSEQIFSDARIGIISLTNATPLDAQNIFSRINRGGTQLKAEELLSAKPYWNRIVPNPSYKITQNVKEMYTKLEIPTPDAIVRWDIAATLISRIEDGNLIFDTYEEAKKNNEISMDEVTLGFKLISSIYQEGMSNKHVTEIEKNESICWDQGLDDLVAELNDLCKLLLEDSFFKFLQSWKKPISKLMTNAIALEFITILRLDWKSKGCPRAGGELKALQRDARILFDRFVFEYATKIWRGSGDSKMANDIKNWKTRLTAVEDENWSQFIKGACIGNYHGQETTKDLLRPVLYYYYILKEMIPLIQADVLFEVDHIIPEERFRGNIMVNQAYKDSLINFALLPKRENICKGSKALNEITDQWLKTQVATYTEINIKDFDTYSNVSNVSKLQDDRKLLFESVFADIRHIKLSN